MSTKGKDNTAPAEFLRSAREADLSTGNHILTSLKLELAYFSGRVWQGRKVGGAGAILRFVRVIPRRSGAFQPLRSNEVTPEFLQRVLRAVKRWKYDVVSLDEACRRAVVLDQPRRFVCFTFDGAYKDVARAAYPILRHHSVPFAVYVPTAFPDGVGEAWWLALEKIIARENRITVVIDRTDRRFSIATTTEKIEAFAFFFNWLRQLPPPELKFAIHDLAKRYSIDVAAVTREAMMDWSDLDRLAADPLVTLASSTVNYPALTSLKDVESMREMTMGKAVAEAAFRRDVRHFAFPFGDRETFRRSHVTMAKDAGFSSAVSTIDGIVDAGGRTNLHALPRIAWDGRITSMRAMRVLLSGAAFAPVKPTPKAVD